MRLSVVIVIMVMFSSIISCNKKPPIQKIDHQQLLAQSLKLRNFTSLKSMMKEIKTTENTQNIIALYSQLEVDSLVKLDQRIDYLTQFYTEMSETHQFMLNEMTKWVYLKRIYQHEISPPIRILQREELYLAPSEIDITLCPNKINNCAFTVRNKLTKHLSNEDIVNSLKDMAEKDPCVNLTKRMQGHLFANKCLKKNKGHLKVSLLKVPSFDTDRWIRILSSGN